MNKQLYIGLLIVISVFCATTVFADWQENAHLLAWSNEPEVCATLPEANLSLFRKGITLPFDHPCAITNKHMMPNSYPIEYWEYVDYFNLTKSQPQAPTFVLATMEQRRIINKMHDIQVTANETETIMTGRITGLMYGIIPSYELYTFTATHRTITMDKEWHLGFFI